MLEHGGRLRAAAARYHIPLADWLDLSTGINPSGWPVPDVPAGLWRQLPEANDGLEAAAQGYYGVTETLPVAGSQAAIQALPRLRRPSRVAVLEPGYAEHAEAWRLAGHQVLPLAAEAVRSASAPPADVVVLIHPNNPTGARFAHTTLLDWQERLAARGGWLVVDEAFIDTMPGDSLAADCPRSGLIVLRSLGKFFGLAGARIGFVIAEPRLNAALGALLGPWTLTNPARWVAQRALADRAWQAAARVHLAQGARRLAALLCQHRLSPAGGCALFQWVRTPDASDLHTLLARQGILTRLFDTPPSLRFGLPGDEPGWTRLAAALASARD